MKKKSSNNFGSYQKRVLLTEEEEIALFEAYLTEPNEKVRKRLLDKIVRTFQPLVPKAVRTMAGYGCEEEELVSEASMALVEAAQRFDLSLENRFSTYAKRWIHGKLLGYIADNKFIVNVASSRKSKKLFFKLRNAIKQETQKQGVMELTHDVVVKVAETLSQEGLQVTPDDIYEFEPLFRSVGVSLNVPANGNRNQESGEIATRQDMLEDDSPNPEENYQTKERNEVLHQFFSEVLAKLPDRERRILIEQALVEDEDQQTLDALSKEYGISKERVRQIRNIAMERVTNEMRFLLRRKRTRAADLLE